MKNINYSIEHKHFVDTAIVESLKGGLAKEPSNRPHVVNPLSVSINCKEKRTVNTRFETRKQTGSSERK